MTEIRDHERAGRLLLTERDALLPILRRTDPADFDLPTVCEGWSVRDVVAHCASALTRAAEGRLHRFTSEDNEADVAERRSWSIADLLAELESGYGFAAPVVIAAGGSLDGLALGVWVHGGDVREALSEPWPYGSEGVEDALALLVKRARSTPLVRARIGGQDLTVGVAVDGREPATLDTDVPTLVRLYAGRRPDPSRYRLSGARPDELVLFS